MPNIDVTYIPCDDFTRQELTKEITQAVVDALPCPATDVHIRFHDVPPTHYAYAGYLDTDGDTALFQMNVAWFAGKNPEMAKALAATLTEKITGILGIEAEKVEIGTDELHRKNYYIGGKPVDRDLPVEARSPLDFVR